MVKIKLLYQDSVRPMKQHYGDAGFDVHALESCLLWPGERHRFPLGFALELPENWVAIISERSGAAHKFGIITLGNIIDCNYRGEVHATLFNSDAKVRYTIEQGDRIAQMLIIPCYTGTELEIVEELSPSNRGEGGFGSTNRS